MVVDLFSSLGTVVRLDKESLLDAVTGLSGSGPAYVMTFLHSLAEGGLKAGLSYSQSLDLALETIAGSVEYFRKLSESDPSLHPMEVRNWVTSPGELRFTVWMLWKEVGLPQPSVMRSRRQLREAKNWVERNKEG